MLDPKRLRNEPETIADALARRGFEFDAPAYDGLESRRKRLQAQVESLQAERNQSAKAIGKAKAAGEDIAALKQAVAGLGEQLAQAKQALAAVRGQLQQVQHGLPNIAHASVPVGADETENVELRRWGEIPQFDFQVRDHLALGEAVAGMEAATAAHMTGARFMVM